MTPSPPPTSNELLKLASPTLAGTIAGALADAQSERFSDDDAQFLKFYRAYQKDDGECIFGNFTALLQR